MNGHTTDILDRFIGEEQRVRAPERTPYDKPTIPIVFDEAYPQEEKPLEWTVRPLMLGPGRVAVVVGAGGGGKTHLVQHIATALENGAPALGGLVPEGPRLRVLHIDTDQGIRATRRRYRRHAVGLGVPRRPALLSLRDMMRADRGFKPTDVDRWCALLRNFDFVIIDALAGLLAAFDLDENSSADTRSVLDALQYASDETHCTVLVIAHTGKDSRDESGKKVQRTDPRGSSGITQGAGVIWAVTGENERGSIRTARRTRDAADDDGDDDLVPEFSFRIERVDAVVPGMVRRDGGPIYGLTVACCDAPSRRDKGEAAEDIRAEIIRAVRAGGLHSQRDIEDRVTGNSRAVRAVFKDLFRDAVIMRDPKGELFVTSKADPS